MKPVLSAVLILALLLSLCPAVLGADLPHGTADSWIRPEQVNNTPPADYRVNSATQAEAMEGKYAAFFLKEALQTVEITLPEDNLNYLLQNAKEEPYVLTESVTIGGTTLGWCGLRTKGNYTLQHAYDDNRGSDRFSFTVNFGEFITKAAYGEKQTLYGCDKISFNNFFFDKSMLKEYFAMKLMEEMGLPTPAYGLAKLYINGEYYGVYFMVEAMDESILERYWQVDGKELSDYLCKPTGTNLRYNSIQSDPDALFGYDEEKGAALLQLLPTVQQWSKKLTNLSTGLDFSGQPLDVNSEEYVALLEQILDLEEVIRYFAASSWLCQLDNMFVNLQNYGLYVSPEGKATLIPWDYDLAFGCYYPSTAENTANYPLDVMYRIDMGRLDSEAQESDKFYKSFPLFYVIYQNDALRQRYHQAMADCSRIAALGGRVNGKDYEPAWFAACIASLQEPLILAAAEKTADNVYYMNGIRQPQDLRRALPNLTAIIAQRAVGVWCQVTGQNTWVSGAGCDLETLGNAITGGYETAGRLTCVNAATGIFASAHFRGGSRSGPVLTVTSPNDQQLAAIAGALEAGEDQTLLAYTLACSAVPAGAVTVTVPLSPTIREPRLYQWKDGALTALEARLEGNLATVTLEALGTVVVYSDQAPAAPEDPAQDNSDPLTAGILVAAGVLLAAALVIIVIKKRKA